MSKPCKTATPGQMKYVAGGDLFINDYIMDKGLSLVFNFTLKIKVESPTDIYRDSIIVTQFVHVPRRTVAKNVPTTIKDELLIESIPARLPQPSVCDKLVQPLVIGQN